MSIVIFFFQAEDGIRDGHVTGVQTCALPISAAHLPADLGADRPSLCRAGAVGVPSRRRRTRDSKRGCHLRRPFEPPCAAIGRAGGRPVLDRAHACGARGPIRVLCPDKAWNAVTARCAWSPLKVSADPASREAKNSLERTRT